ncbi:iron ABC transporter ATP-binding protein [Agromyces sp. NPDC056523]|uniref:iron ABC transporter ATP-binding protein n=1 Tax=Agromyces sp. NPDC056523 TaxID=3345850 RepID=UPI00366E21D7
MSRPNTPSSRLAGLALAALATAAVLSGCTTGSDPGATDAPTASGSPAPSGPATAVPTPEPTEEPIPFEIACDAMLTADQLYAFNPNFGTAPGYEPSDGAVSEVVDAEGTACGWSNQTSGELIEIGVATLPPGAFDLRVGQAAMSSNPVPTYGTPPDVEGFFLLSGGVGQAQVFTGERWIVVESEVLVEPGDAQQLVASVLANLP